MQRREAWTKAFLEDEIESPPIRKQGGPNILALCCLMPTPRGPYCSNAYRSLSWSAPSPPPLELNDVNCALIAMHSFDWYEQDQFQHYQ